MYSTLSRDNDERHVAALYNIYVVYLGEIPYMYTRALIINSKTLTLGACARGTVVVLCMSVCYPTLWVPKCQKYSNQVQQGASEASPPPCIILIFFPSRTCSHDYNIIIMAARPAGTIPGEVPHSRAKLHPPGDTPTFII
jgi:hypothetical protein